MTPSSRTPEGEPNRCPFCNKKIRIEPSTPPGDAPCPFCGCLVWFDPVRFAVVDEKQKLVETTKRQIRDMVAQITELEKQTELGAEEYFAAFLPLVVSCLAAHGGAAWIGTGSDLKLAYCFKQEKFEINEDRFRGDHFLLVQNIFRQGKPSVIPPGEDLGAGAGCNATGSLLLFSPIKGMTRNVGIVEIFQRPEIGESTSRGSLRFLLQMCILAGESFAMRTLEIEQVVGTKKKKPWWKIWK